jgi:flavin-dependent dehydrogenase
MLLASGPFDWTMTHTVLPGAALVGDAAGYYDPFTGQGIFQALAGAELLAAEADAALRAAGGRPPLLREYARERRRLVRGPRALQRVIEAVLSRPRLANGAIAHLGRSRALADALVAVTGDLIPAADLLRPRVLLTFLAPGTAEVVG